MRIPSGKTDQNIYFVAQLGGARVTGLSSFTVVRSRNGAADVTYTTPTTTEIDAATMPGVYSLLVDEDTTIASGSDSEEMALHITKTGMDPVTRTFELYRRTATTGETIDVASGGVEVGTFQAGAITATAIAADAITDAKVASDVTIASVTGAVGSVTGAVGSVTGSVGSVVGAVGSVTGLTAADVGAIKLKTDNLPTDPADESLIIAATDALATLIGDVPTNAELTTALGTADDAVLAAVAALNNLSQANIRTAVGLASANLDTQIATLATAAALDTVDNLLDLEIPALTTAVADLPTNAELATALGTADDALLTQVALVKTQTDKLTFTVANVLDANVQYVNDVAVTGTGAAGDEWGP